MLRRGAGAIRAAVRAAVPVTARARIGAGTAALSSTAAVQTDSSGKTTITRAPGPPPKPFREIPNLGGGKATYCYQGTFFAPEGKLDEMLAAYKKHGYDFLVNHKYCISYAIVKDEKNNSFTTISTWTSYEDCSSVMTSPEFAEQIKAVLPFFKDMPKPPVNVNLPVYCSKH